MPPSPSASIPPSPKPKPSTVAPVEISAAPVIVFTYAYAGGLQVQEILDREHGLACTTGTGVLSACLQAARTWSKVEDREGEPLTRLAATSVRSMVTTMIGVIAARTGRRRWCDVAAPEPEAAELFRLLFPDTRFICVQRACPDVVYAITRASPWGIGAGFVGYAAAHPASTVAALTAWWVNRAGLIADFGQAHPEACLRVRYEDLYSDRAGTMAAVRAFLGLSRETSGVPAELAGPPEPSPSAHPSYGSDVPGCGAGFPIDQLPPPLAERVDALHDRLGYPPLATRATTFGSATAASGSVGG